MVEPRVRIMGKHRRKTNDVLKELSNEQQGQNEPA